MIQGVGAAGTKHSFVFWCHQNTESAHLHPLRGCHILAAAGVGLHPADGGCHGDAATWHQLPAQAGGAGGNARKGSRVSLLLIVAALLHRALLHTACLPACCSTSTRFRQCSTCMHARASASHPHVGRAHLKALTALACASSEW